MLKLVGSILFTALMLLYPFIVYHFLQGDIGSRQLIMGGVLVSIGLFRLCSRFWTPQKSDLYKQNMSNLLACLALVLGLCMLLQQSSLPAKLYPVGVSLLFFGFFVFSLFKPPTMIERLARITHPQLPDQAIPHLERTTYVWIVFFLLNAVISAFTVYSGNLQWWLLYNGLISYLVMGFLFIGEFIVRQFVMKKINRELAQ